MDNISVILLANNNTKNINLALNSICEQNVENIELICIGNSFNLSDLECIKAYQQTYKFVKLIILDTGKNIIDHLIDILSDLQSNYVLIFNPNYYFETKAFFEFANILKDNAVDVLQFKTSIIRENNVTNFQKNFAEQSLKLFSGVINENIIYECFVNKKFSLNIFDKFIKKDILLKALQNASVHGVINLESVILLVYILEKSSIYYGYTTKISAHWNLRAWKYVLERDDIDTIINCYSNELNYLFSFFRSNDSTLSIKEKNGLIQLLGDNLFKTFKSLRIKEEDRSYFLLKLIKGIGVYVTIALMQKYLSYDLKQSTKYFYLLSVLSEITYIPCNRNMLVVGAESDQDIKILNKERVFFVGYNNALEGNDGYYFLSKLNDDDVINNTYKYLDLVNFVHKNKINILYVKHIDASNIYIILLLKLCGCRVITYLGNYITNNRFNIEKSLDEYFSFLYQLIITNLVLVPKYFNVCFLDTMGIQYRLIIDDFYDLKEFYLHYNDKANVNIQFYNSLLMDQYKRGYYRFNVIGGPFLTVLYRNININNIRNGIKLALLKEKIQESNLYDKTIIVIKTFLRILGFKYTLGLHYFSPSNPKPLHIELKKSIKLLLSPRLLLNKIKNKKLSKLYSEKKFSYGEENPEKVFYSIRMNPDGNEGILLVFLRFLRELKRLENTGLIPIIDMKWTYYQITNNNKKDKRNGWEIYFKSVAGFSLDDVQKSKNFIRGQICYREEIDNFIRSNIMKFNTDDAKKEFNEWSRLTNKYMHLNDELKKVYDEEFKSLLSGKRVIGVMVREGYESLNKLNYALISNHAKQPTIQQVINDLQTKMIEWKCDYIYVSAEYQETIDLMKKAFGNKVLYTERFRKNIQAQNAEEYRKKRDQYYSQITREQINKDYLKEVYFLSKCTSLLCGRASATIVAALWNGGAYENRYIYELGKYNIDNSKKVVTLEEKQ